MELDLDTYERQYIWVANRTQQHRKINMPGTPMGGNSTGKSICLGRRLDVHSIQRVNNLFAH